MAARVVSGFPFTVRFTFSYVRYRYKNESKWCSDLPDSLTPVFDNGSSSARLSAMVRENIAKGCCSLVSENSIVCECSILEPLTCNKFKLSRGRLVWRSQTQA